MLRRYRCVLPAASLGALLACDKVPGRDVRYEPSPMPVVRAMLELAEVGPDDVVYDLGSGDGRIPITAAKEFGARGVGIEIDPELVVRARASARDAGVEDKVEFILGDMYEADVREATVVTLFLHPQPNLKLRRTLRSQLEAGSRVVSYIWDMGDWKPDAIRTLNRRDIYLWRIAAKSTESPSTRRSDLPPRICPVLCRSGVLASLDGPSDPDAERPGHSRLSAEWPGKR